jgi:hypothetical protein
MNSFLKWWLIFCTSLLIGYTGYYLGFFQELLDKDVTKLSFVILGLFVLASFMVGWSTWDKSKGKDVTARVEVGWFVSESMLALGMIGTVAGFILMLGSSFESIDTSNQATLKDALTAMALGMSTALYTTLVGLICSQLFKVQLVNIETSNNEKT